ncbi:uncharacterized protein LOC119440205 [Dermacentor silvarum]|uniref:uncharacterized protein LOC119440205 n=1 Tax=Dermacentor silvarum TaxID=543639 RepID=UPI00189AF845|nr:uncharacterized protein LOC119440205 [Dermacentor silvarum]
MVIETRIPQAGTPPPPKLFKWTDWDKFRKQRVEQRGEETIDNIEAWMETLNDDMNRATQTVTPEVQVDKIDSRLAHLWEAKTSLYARWKKQRHNRKLRKKIALINRQLEEHCRTLSRQQWYDICNAIDGQLHNGSTWRLLRHLLGETQGKSAQRANLQRLLHKERATTSDQQIVTRLLEKYFPQRPDVQHGDYTGKPNATLDEEFHESEIRAALHDLNGKSAPGPDKVTNKTLRNLDDVSITALTTYVNKCWRVMEHAFLTRINRHLEDTGAYPSTMVGFRSHLSTQDVMLQLYHQIINDPTSGTRAILGLDLEKAFDNVSHAAILSRINKLNMGERSYNYIRDFLSCRTVTLAVDSMTSHEHALGSAGTPQGKCVIILKPSPTGTLYYQQLMLTSHMPPKHCMVQMHVFDISNTGRVKCSEMFVQNAIADA